MYNNKQNRYGMSMPNEYAPSKKVIRSYNILMIIVTNKEQLSDVFPNSLKIL